MELNNIKENLERKQTYKEIKKSKRQECFSNVKRIFNSRTFECIAINIVLAIIIVFCSYSYFNSIDLLDYNSVHHDIIIMTKIAIGIVLILFVGLITPALMFVESKIQDLAIKNKLNKMSYKRMQYIPLTKAEFVKLEIHNITDYATFLNEFLKVKVDYFHFWELLDWDQTRIATPPRMVINKINESLMCLDEIPENGQQIEFHYTDGFVVCKSCKTELSILDFFKDFI